VVVKTQSQSPISAHESHQNHNLQSRRSAGQPARPFTPHSWEGAISAVANPGSASSQILTVILSGAVKGCNRRQGGQVARERESPHSWSRQEQRRMVMNMVSDMLNCVTTAVASLYSHGVLPWKAGGARLVPGLAFSIVTVVVRLAGPTRLSVAQPFT
jgi:hypothetical protein